MTKGIVMIAFGDYLPFALDCLDKSDLSVPVTLLISEEGPDVSPPENVEIRRIHYRKDRHRSAKTQLYQLTPYDKTIYLDCDCVINKDISHLFDLIGDGLLLNPYNFIYRNNRQVIALYKKAADEFKCTHPLKVFNGAFIGFSKPSRASVFFFEWNMFWIMFGMGREMPPLACAVQRSKIKVTELEKGIFAPDGYQKDALIQHYYTGFEKQYSIKKALKRHITKHDHPEHWRWVNY